MRVQRAFGLAIVAFSVAIGTVAQRDGASAASPPLYTLTTPNPQASADFGSAASSGDVNGDGKADVVVGADTETVGGNASQGRAYVFSGPDGSLLRTLTTPNAEANAYFGDAVAAGDVNGDGKADVIVGAWGETAGGNARQGRAYVFSGPDGSLLRTLTTPNAEANAYFGDAVAAGDVNGDGKADVIVGAWGETAGGNARQGRAYVFSGSDGSLLRTLTTPSTQPDADFGQSVAMGELNGDGKADVIVGSYNEVVGLNSGQGRAYAFSGADGSLLRTLTTPNAQAGARFGIAVAAGNMNGDGKADVVVGAPYESVGDNAQQGRAYVFSGADGSLLRTLTTPNALLGAWFGNAVAAGDANGDGKADIVVGALGWSGTTVLQGQAYVFSGVNGSLMQTLDTPNPQSGNFGSSVATGDVNGDGRADIVVGAPYEDVGAASNQGRAYVFSAPVSVGGVAEQPEIAALPFATTHSSRRSELLKLVPAALGLFGVGVAGWYGTRRRRSRL